MPTPNRFVVSPLVLITGITGYLAGQVAVYLLATGFRVRGTVVTVRSLRDASSWSQFGVSSAPVETASSPLSPTVSIGTVEATCCT